MVENNCFRKKARLQFQLPSIKWGTQTVACHNNVASTMRTSDQTFAQFIYTLEWPNIYEVYLLFPNPFR